MCEPSGWDAILKAGALVLCTGGMVFVWAAATKWLTK